MMSQPKMSIGVDFEAIQETVSEILGKDVKEVDFIGKNECYKVFSIKLIDDTEVVLRSLLKSLPVYVMESEVATIRYLAAKTTIPVPRVLHFNSSCDFHPLGVFMLSEKFNGTKLSTIFSSLSQNDQDLIVKQIAHWSIELFKHRFDSIGSLYTRQAEGSIDDTFFVGPISHPLFYGEERGSLPLNRGPFEDSRAYFKACQQRELDSARTQCLQEMSDSYQRNVADARFVVERCMALLGRAIDRCQGLAEDDPSLNELSLSMAELDLNRIYVATDAPSLVICFPFWYGVSTRPLWHCAQLPAWLTTSLSEGQSLDRDRWTDVFRRSIQSIDGSDSLFLKALDMEQTRQTIDHVCDYNAFTDGFLLLPTLESLIATLPGEEDMDGLQELLDPRTLEGRAARIALLTKGTYPLSLATEGILEKPVRKLKNVIDQPAVPVAPSQLLPLVE